jgi:hypothetical protein
LHTSLYSAVQRISAPADIFLAVFRKFGMDSEKSEGSSNMKDEDLKLSGVVFKVDSLETLNGIHLDLSWVGMNAVAVCITARFLPNLTVY